MEYKPGLRIGTFILTERVDTGGEAEVWKAEKNGLTVAMKLRKPARLDEREDVTNQTGAHANETDQWIQFTRESVHIVNILDITSEILDDDDGAQWVVHSIVSEFSELGDLQKAIETGELKRYLSSELHFIQFLLDIISGVRAGHQAQRYHCDIKPKNILLFRNAGRVVPKLADFGIAGTALQPSKGVTPGYGAPEIKPGVTPSAQSDVYSLGITFYDILYATIMRPVSGLKTARFYNSGRAYKEYLRESADTTEPMLVVPYKELMASMAEENPGDRPSLDEIMGVLELGLRRVIASGPQYEVKTKPDTYLWDPSVHEALDERLYYILVKGGNPALDLRHITNDLAQAGFSGFSLRSVIGAWDYVVRIWISRNPAALEKAKGAIRRSGRIQVLEVAEAHLTPGRQRKKASRTKSLKAKVSDVQILKEIEKNAGSGAYERLHHAGYVTRRLNRDSRNFRVTLLVTVDQSFGKLVRVVGDLIMEHIQPDPRAKELSYYDVKPIDDGNVRLVVKFMHTSFTLCRATLLGVFEALGDQGNHFTFSTLLDMNAELDQLSDDGSIISRIQTAHS